jgi:hypothetical protein
MSLTFCLVIGRSGERFGCSLGVEPILALAYCFVTNSGYMPEDHTFASTVRGGVSRDNESVLKREKW